MSELEIDYNDDDMETEDETPEPKITLVSTMETRRKIEEMLERKRTKCPAYAGHFFSARELIHELVPQYSAMPLARALRQINNHRRN
jgi:hypothetical protein